MMDKTNSEHTHEVSREIYSNNAFDHAVRCNSKPPAIPVPLPLGAEATTQGDKPSPSGAMWPGKSKRRSRSVHQDSTVDSKTTHSWRFLKDVGFKSTRSSESLKSSKPSKSEPVRLEILSDVEVEFLTRCNTKRNGHRNLRARIERVKQAVQVLSAEPEIDALPLVRPCKKTDETYDGDRSDSNLGSTSNCRPAATSTNGNNTTVGNAHGEIDMQLKLLANEIDNGLDLEPASFESFTPDVHSAASLQTPQSRRYASQPGHVRQRGPAVRISTAVTVHSWNKTRNMAQLQDRTEHPSRDSARVLIAKSAQVGIDPKPVGKGTYLNKNLHMSLSEVMAECQALNLQNSSGSPSQATRR